ncbi:MAG: histidine--tRNA ligase [Clostridia bacterium]|nr:histidine--tRNA ligase [Clostridia bacterium]
MELITKAPRGTQDVLPGASSEWQHIERTALSIAEDYGFREIRTPVFEHTELFQRSVGETTDVVQKEMYTFEDKGNRSITLRPEGTAGAARAVLENGLIGGALPLKVSYVTACYRYEKPQAGRLREFHQFGVEMFGASAPTADAEVIALGAAILEEFKVPNITLYINSIGCPECRKKYQEALKEYFTAHKGDLCETCLGRLERNPMRILDCKSKVCSAIAEKAPVILDYLCEECQTHFDGVQDCLKAAGIAYKIDPRIVRGLDYYTRTVFEFVSRSDALGSQATVCGGGRYDGLIEELGGPQTPALGFGMGLERLLLTLKDAGYAFPKSSVCEVYFAPMGDKAVKECFALVTQLRNGGVSAQTDVVGRGLKAQMKYADKLGARYTVVVGDNELETRKAQLKDMQTGTITEVDLDDGLYTTLYNLSLDRQLAGVAEMLGQVAEN